MKEIPFEMKLLAAPKYLSDAIAPLMTLNYLTGLRIVEYPRGQVRVALNLAYLLLLLSIYGISVYMEHKYFNNSHLLKLEYVLYSIIVYVNAIVIMYEMILGSMYTKQLNDCYRKISHIDETLRQLGSMFNYRGIHLFTIGAIIISFLYICIVSIVTIVHVHMDLATRIWIIVSHVYGINVSFIVIFEFSMFVMCLEMKFKLVNELLNEGATISSMDGIKLGLFSAEDYPKVTGVKQRRHILFIKVLSQLTRPRISVTRNRNFIKSRPKSRLPTQLQKQFRMELQGQLGNQSEDLNPIQRSIVVAKCDQERKHLLQTIRQVHLELCKVSKVLCTSFGLQITSEIGISIIIVSGLLYNLYVRFVEKRNHYRNSLLDQMFLVIMWGITYVLKVIIINRVCKKATYEGKKTTEIIHAIYRRSTDTDMRDEIQQFGLQMSQSPVDFSAFGVSLNFNVLSSCLKTVTTYVVIMIQMGNSLESSEST